MHLSDLEKVNGVAQFIIDNRKQSDAYDYGIFVKLLMRKVERAH